MLSLFLSMHIPSQSIEITNGIPADFNDFFDIKRIYSSLSGFEGNFDEFYSFSVVYDISGEHNIRNVEVFGELGEKFAQDIRSHQTKGGVGV